MIKISEDQFKHYEVNYPGITEQILRFDKRVMPPCPFCNSTDTAVVICGIIGRTIHIASATSRVKLLANRDQRHFYCHSCKQYFDLLY